MGSTIKIKEYDVTSLTKKVYSYYYLLPALLIYIVLFIIPTFMSFFFSFTRWTLFDWEFVGFYNFITFFSESSLNTGFWNSLIYGVLTCGLRVILGLSLAVFLTTKIKTRNYLRAVIFFPTLVSTVAVGVIFKSLLNPTRGLINQALEAVGIHGPSWLGNPHLALYAVIFVDVWKGLGVATVIYIAGLMSIPPHYYEACAIDGGNSLQKFFHITLPLIRPAMNAVIILSLIYGLKSFDLIWAMTGGGPGFSTEVIASVIYKQYINGFYGLSTAGNVILFIMISIIAFPLYKFLSRGEVEY